MAGERRCGAGSGELAELGSCGKAPAHAKAQRVQGCATEIARKALAVDGMPVVVTIAVIGALRGKP